MVVDCERIIELINKGEMLTYFVEHYDKDTIYTDLFDCNKTVYSITAEEYKHEIKLFFKEWKEKHELTPWKFRDKIRSQNIEVLIITNYEAIVGGMYQEIFEVLIWWDIQAREDLLLKTVLTTEADFTPVISERLKYIIQK